MQTLSFVDYLLETLTLVFKNKNEIMKSAYHLVKMMYHYYNAK